MNQSKVDATTPVSKNWLRVIQYCKQVSPHSDITISIRGGEPVELLGEKRKIRFDKEGYFSETTEN